MEVGKYYKSSIGHVIKVISIIRKDRNYKELPSAVFVDIIPNPEGWASPCPISWMDDYEEAPKYNSPLWKAVND